MSLCTNPSRLQAAVCLMRRVVLLFLFSGGLEPEAVTHVSALGISQFTLHAHMYTAQYLPHAFHLSTTLHITHVLHVCLEPTYRTNTLFVVLHPSNV